MTPVPGFRRLVGKPAASFGLKKFRRTNASADGSVLPGGFRLRKVCEPMMRHRNIWSLCFSVWLVMTGVGLAASVLPARVLALTGSSAAAGRLASAFALS